MSNISNLDLGALDLWFQKNQRPLPWRQNRDPYLIWISEVMLQQTTTRAVIPYFDNFIKKFPNLKALAKSSIEDVYPLWSGLGYYSRARNLHKAAQAISLLGYFPQTYSELLNLPGFGPYTARAVSSQAFNEAVGVVDGNVIRVLSRKLGQPFKWWTREDREKLQDIADQIVQGASSGERNQALMELGATVCMPQTPHCIHCPWLKSCHAQQMHTQSQLPLKKPQRAKEFWVWQPNIIIKNKKVALVKNDYAPFLKNALIFPGKINRVQKKPKEFAFKHMITHHEIFVIPQKTKKSSRSIQWIELKKVPTVSPTSLIKKTLAVNL